VFPFTGLIRCGACGASVTAEHKTNRYGYHYTYYHCSKRRLGPRCRQPSIEESALDGQIAEFLDSLAISNDLHKWIIEEVEFGTARSKDQEEIRKKSLTKSLDEVEAQLAELTGLRLRNLLTDDEFVAQRRTLQQEQRQLRETIARIEKSADTFEPLRDFFSFSTVAADWFRHGDLQAKRLIVETVGSNLTLIDKILSIEARKPFVKVTKSADRSCLLGVVDDVRTSRIGNKRWLRKWVKEVRNTLSDEKGQRIFNNIRALRQHFEPETVKQTSRRAGS